jgi:hypothetical protein
LARGMSDAQAKALKRKKGGKRGKGAGGGG